MQAPSSLVFEAFLPEVFSGERLMSAPEGKEIAGRGTRKDHRADGEVRA